MSWTTNAIHRTARETGALPMFFALVLFLLLLGGFGIKVLGLRGVALEFKLTTNLSSIAAIESWAAATRGLSDTDILNNLTTILATVQSDVDRIMTRNFEVFPYSVFGSVPSTPTSMTIETGVWDFDAQTFTTPEPAGTVPNAFRVTLPETEGDANSIFGRLIAGKFKISPQAISAINAYSLAGIVKPA